jgi:hypothetical protein
VPRVKQGAQGDSDKVPVDIWLPLLNKSLWVED